MNTPVTPTPPYQLPGNQFTVWTHPVLPAAHPAPAGKAKIVLPGNQFTVWTKPVAKDPVAAKTTTVTNAAAPDAAKGRHWLETAALFALPVVIALWIWDHRSNTKDFRRLSEEKKEQITRKHRVLNRAKELSHQLAEKSALLTDLETKAQTVGKERDGAKQDLATTAQSLKSLETDAASNATKLATATKELAAVRKELADKETALGNSVSTLQSEVSKLKQTYEQENLNLRASVAKMEAEKATAQKDAAAATLKVTELAAQAEQLKKDLEAAKGAPKP